MTDTMFLYKMLDEAEVPVYDFALPRVASCSIKEGPHMAVGMDYRKLPSAADMRVRLAHEAGHCMTDSFYNRYTCYDVRGKHERAATVWAIKKLIPKNELKKYLNEIDARDEDIAERFGVTLPFLRQAMAYYSGQY